ncbi:unnamed protein product, partial [Amoebophrya sp. A25]|eukprot:GSA25T00000856001.1
MCSFLLVSWILRNLSVINTYLKARGPDATYLYKKDAPAHWELLFNHLHMTGAERPQPFWGESAFATFNGEIYNWAELANDLQENSDHEDDGNTSNQGEHEHTQHTGSTGSSSTSSTTASSLRIRSDGDVILPMYRRYGPKFIQRLDGEFAIVVVDLAKQLVIVSTDVFGTKPLYISAFAVSSAPAGREFFEDTNTKATGTEALSSSKREDDVVVDHKDIRTKSS